MNYDGLDLHEDAYCAVNCKSGIFACILERSLGVDPSAVWFHAPLGVDDVAPGMEAGEIAGFSCGNFANALWGELFDADVVEWRPESPSAMEEWLGDALRRHRMVLVTHDGFYDPLAADKYQRSHTAHNSMLYGLAGDQRSYAIADRGYRAHMSAGDLWRSVEGEIGLFATITRARPFAGDADALVATGLHRLRRAARAEENDLRRFGALVVKTVRDDVRTPAGRWLQTHAFFNGIGASRQRFGDALSAARVAGHDAGSLLTCLADGADRWKLLSRFVYKVVSSGRVIDPQDLFPRLEAALDADATVYEAVAPLVATTEASR